LTSADAGSNGPDAGSNGPDARSNGPDAGSTGPDAGLTRVCYASCPYCGESVEVLVDPGGGPVQVYVEDCEVCCHPWSVRVEFDPEGHASISLATLDDE
jgi:hypothetical protein